MVDARLLSLMLLTALLAGMTSTASAEIRTILEPRLIDEMETVRLTLRVAGSSPDTPPDFSALEQDFDLLGTQTSSRISSINGRTSAVVEYQINLRPKRTGEIRLPQIRIGNDVSEALTLAVRPIDPSVREAIRQMIFFESELTDNPVYVQAQTVLIRRLFYSNGVQIYSDLPGAPEVADAVVLQLGDSRSARVIRDGRQYGVIEQRFAIFPETSGELVIPEIGVTSSVRLPSGGRTRRSGIRVNTDPITVSVLPIPAGYPASEPWLPAQSVALDVQWLPEAASYDVGEPVSVRVQAIAVGNVGSAIPPLDPGLSEPDFKVYPEAAILEDDATAEQVIGQRDQTFALIPAMPGQVQVPAISLTWWDTVADRLRVSEIPAGRLTISGSLPETSAPAAQPGIQSDATSLGNDIPDSGSTGTELAVEGRWLWMVVVLILLAAVTGVGYRIFGLPAWVSGRVERRQQQKIRWQTLIAAAEGGDLHGFRNALTQYLAAHFNCSAALAWRRLAEYPDAATQLNALESALYSRDAQHQFDSRELLKLLRTLPRTHSRSVDLRGELPPLYGQTGR